MEEHKISAVNRRPIPGHDIKYIVNTIFRHIEYASTHQVVLCID